MTELAQYSEITATFIARVFLGMLFFFQGYDAVFRVKVENVISTYESSFQKRGVPRFFTAAGVWVTSFTELIGGLLLILGLLQPLALCLLGINILVATLAFSIASPVWDLRHVFPRVVLLIFLFLVPQHWNLFSIDHLFTLINK